jgi:hypothetical protein
MTSEAECREPELVVTDNSAVDAEAAIEHGLAGYNIEKASFAHGRSLAVLLKQPGTEEIAGGLLGRTSYGLFFIDLVFLPAWARGRGLGAGCWQPPRARPGGAAAR